MKTPNPRKDLGTFTFLSKYARFLPEQQRRETYEEAVDRMMSMHETHLGAAAVNYRPMLDRVSQAIKDRRILGSQRALQFGGDSILRKNMRIYNCSASFCDRPRFFAEAFWLLLCGCGVGFSVQKHHVDKLPRLQQPSRGVPCQYAIEDSIEGWADALTALLESYIEGTPAVSFDYSEVRPEGSLISGTNGRAPGPKPLRDSLEAVRVVLDRVVAAGGVIRPIDAYDVVMHTSLAVRAGGVRRSATIALFSPDDDEMASAKTGTWYNTNPQRRMSNNSALLVRTTSSRAEFDALVEATQQFGEPGFYFTESTEHATNPCAEILLDPVWEGDDTVPAQTAWAMCNLSTVNVAACKTEVDFLEACELAAALGTVQATYVDAGYLGEATTRVLQRDALLGVSLTGMADNPDLAFDERVLLQGSALVLAVNRHYARQFGISPAARTTTVKPEGTGSLVLGVGNGIHPHHARKYLRYVEGGKRTDPLVKFMAESIPGAVVQNAYNADEVKIVFPIDLGEGPLWLKAETDPIDHLKKVKSVQEAWVRPGTARGDASHNVSNTVVVPPDAWEAVAEFLWSNRDSFGGVSLLGTSGDLDYPQAPFVEVLTEAQIQEKYRNDPVRAQKARDAAGLFDHLTEKWQALDFTLVREYEDVTAVAETVACAGGACIF